MVVVLHGCSLTAEDAMKMTEWNHYADSLGLFILYPEQRVKNNMSRCFNWFLPDDYSGSSGELASIHQMINHTIENYPIDTSRIYVYGLSAGAAMSVSLMVNYPWIFKAGAIIAGGPYGCANNAMEANRVMNGKTTKVHLGKILQYEPVLSFEGSYPELVVIHGTEDRTVSPKCAEQLVWQWKLSTTSIFAEFLSVLILQ
jgi:feruloyl esterase